MKVIIPNTTGDVLIEWAFDGPSTILIWEHTIAGWVVSASEGEAIAEPVIADELPGRWALKRQNGSVCIPFCTIWETFDDFKDEQKAKFLKGNAND